MDYLPFGRCSGKYLERGVGVDMSETQIVLFSALIGFAVVSIVFDDEFNTFGPWSRLVRLFTFLGIWFCTWSMWLVASMGADLLHILAQYQIVVERVK
jgi:hypothetical protein